MSWYFPFSSGTDLCWLVCFLSVGFSEVKCYMCMLAGVGGDGENMYLCVLYVFVDKKAEGKNDFPEDTVKNLALRNSGE